MGRADKPSKAPVESIVCRGAAANEARLCVKLTEPDVLYILDLAE